MVSDVAGHYTVDDLEGRILAALVAAGHDVDTLSADDLAPVDAFHIRGRSATEELAGWADLQPGDRVLDAGCGLGGTTRFLAATFGCTVTGLDLTDAYCRVAETLSSRVGLAEHTSFHQGDALSMPFADDAFDAVWTEHVQMNIADKAGFYGELARVLKPGGRLAFHDIFAGAVPGLHLPVPWAGDPSISHLVGVDDLRDLLADLGFEAACWEDKTAASIAFFRETRQRNRDQGFMPVGIHLLMGDDAAEKLDNVLRNLVDDRIRVLQAVMTLGSAV